MMAKQQYVGLWPKQAPDVEVVPIHDLGDGVLGLDSKWLKFVTLSSTMVIEGEVRSLVDNQLLYLIGTSIPAIKLRKLELRIK